jgi:hypothetical protein
LANTKEDSGSINDRPDLHVKDATKARLRTKQSLYILFIDFKKAYDSIERNKLYQAMIPKKLIGLTRMTLTDTQNKISAVRRLPESFG